MDRVIFENVRCFRGRHEAPLRPLTVLVGENSSGKTTFLALVRLAWDVAQIRELDFNEEPFTLGSFEQIASMLGSDGRRAKALLIGSAASPSSQYLSYSSTATFVSEGGRPLRRKWRLKAEGAELSGDETGVKLLVPGSSVRLHNLDGSPMDATDLQLGLSTAITRSKKDVPEGITQERDRALAAITKTLASIGSRPLAFAPVRSRPQRTYDPVKDTPDPEGAHIPMILRGALAGQNGDLAAKLAAFGRASGLFETVEVRHLGESSSDPFQLQVRLGGGAFNLVDVGYGVSQILPIIVDCVRAKKGGTFLLQQPEVHLHPQAQAELATFLGTLAKTQRKRFVIETHSDHLIDRIRMDIRDGSHLKPEDVALLYFERVKGEAEARIHHLELDEYGNLLNVPPSYRRFFLEEERRFIGG